MPFTSTRNTNRGTPVASRRRLSPARERRNVVGHVRNGAGVVVSLAIARLKDALVTLTGFLYVPAYFEGSRAPDSVQSPAFLLLGPLERVHALIL